MGLHIGFEQAEPLALKRVDIPDEKARAAGREKFDSHRFKVDKDKVIDLLMRVTTVSVQTVRVVEAMKAAPRYS
jgi:hypothetical protein